MDGVVSTCVAPLAARHAPIDANRCDRGAVAATHPARQAPRKSPSEGSNECGEATNTTESSLTPSDLFFASQYRDSPPCVARHPFGRPVLPEVKNTCESLFVGNAGGGVDSPAEKTSRDSLTSRRDAAGMTVKSARPASVHASLSLRVAPPSPASSLAIATEHPASSKTSLILAGGSVAPTGTTAPPAKRMAKIATGNSTPSSTRSPTVGDRPSISCISDSLAA
mmetsp:Transcript_2870/g.10675  ORF Transcript_2870/g.10675 Transcript_2870/m.10675 type:complete len:224 (+) Transcript_2870:1358-2029(+)